MFHRSPYAADAVLIEHGICAYDWEAVDLRLRDEQAVEQIEISQIDAALKNSSFAGSTIVVKANGES